MPVTPSYPGVYIEEVPSGAHTIVGTSTGETAFIDYFTQGPTDTAVRVTSLTEFQKRYGGLNAHSEASYAIMQFFLNGGQAAWVVRVTAGDAKAATVTLKNEAGTTDVLKVLANSVGTWGMGLEVGITYSNLTDDKLFNFVVRQRLSVNGQTQIVNSEMYANVSIDPSNPNYVINVVNNSSGLVLLETAVTPLQRPAQSKDGSGNIVQVTSNVVLHDTASAGFFKLAGEASDGDIPPDANGNSPTGNNWKEHTGATALVNGLQNLEKTTFNILCIPAASALNQDGMKEVMPHAIKSTVDNRAFFIIDVPQETKLNDLNSQSALDQFLNDQFDGRNSGMDHAALYFPRLTIPDPLNANKPRNVGPSGTMAGLYVRTDTERGIWKAPAGVEAVLNGAALTMELTDAQNGEINPLGINALRSFSIYGNVCWGARTLDGADLLSSDFKYINVRRLTSYIESTLYEGTRWTVFEPNDETLWSQLRMSIGTFMTDLQNQGAFYSYKVNCDATTTTPNDVAQGIVNILVAFAPVNPDEFVVLKIQQQTAEATS